MRFTYALPLLFAGLSVQGVIADSSSQIVLSSSDDLDVPGQNPLQFCDDPKDYLLTIDKVNLKPNPPKAGETLSIKAKGELSETVKKGGKVHIQVKYGLITLINQEQDLCDVLDKVDKSCPLKKGDLTFTKDVNLPKQIPPGKYTVLADAYTKDGVRITCLTSTIQFG